MNTGVVLWSHAIYTRHLPMGIDLKPGRNVLSHDQWEAVKDKSRVLSLLEAGQNGGLTVGDLCSELHARIEAGEPISIVNELPIEEAVAYVYAEEDAAKLKELLLIVRFPQVAVAIQHRLVEIERPKVSVRKRKGDE